MLTPSLSRSTLKRDRIFDQFFSLMTSQCILDARICMWNSTLPTDTNYCSIDSQARLCSCTRGVNISR
jgi:hypothetical protein